MIIASKIHRLSSQISFFVIIIIIIIIIIQLRSAWLT